MSIDVWRAMGALSPEERNNLCRVFREAWETTVEFEPTDLADWGFLLFAAQEIGFARDSDAGFAQDPKGLDPEGTAARAEGIAR